MNNVNNPISALLSKLWSEAPHYVLLVIILFFQVRTESKMDARFKEIELTLRDIRNELRIHDYRLNSSEKRPDKLENK